MATPTIPAPRDVPSQHPTAAAPAAGYDRFIETQIRRTRRQVKGVDLVGSLMLLAAGTVVYLLAAALADHWLVTGGLGFWGRLLACLGLVGGVLVFAAVRLWPLVVGRINPVYAAEAIERGRPSLKNSLVNFLLLRSRPEQVPSVVYQAVEQQAARGLSGVSIDSAIDRSILIRLGWALLIVVSTGMLYWAFSPKDMLQSVSRVILPWSDIEAPTSVQIRDVQPGNAQGFHDQRLTVSARVLGVAAGEPVRLRYTTADNQVVDKELRMHLPEGGYRYQVELPAESEGLQEDLQYMILAGDARTRVYQVKVLTAPSIEVQSVEYEYPPYTEMPPHKVERLGDVRALEGTKVTIRALASHPIKSAYLDFDCDGRRDLSLTVAEKSPDGSSGRRAQRHASVSFTLALAPNTDQPVHDSYQLRFRNFDGHENSQPVRHSIDCIRDAAPEIALAEPQLDPKEPVDLPAGQALPLTLVASDPDFKLADVRLQARRPNSKLADKLVLDEGLLSEPRAGQFRRNFVLNPGRHGLKAGDVVQFWAAALDNKQPQANRTETPRFTLRITSPDGQQPQDQLAKAEDKNQQRDESQDRRDQRPQDGDQRPNEKQQDRGQRNDDQNDSQDEGQPDEGEQQEPGEAKSGGKQGNQKQGNQARDGNSDDQQPGEPDSQEQDAGEQPRGGRQADSGQTRSGQAADSQSADGEAGSDAESSKQETSERVDPESDPGAAIERINNLLRQQGQQDNQPAGEEPQRQQSTGDKPEQAGQPDAAEQKQESGDKQPAGDKPDAAQKTDSDQKRDGQQKDGQEQTGQQQTGQEPAGKEQARKEQAGKEQPGKEQAGKEQAGKEQRGKQGSRPMGDDSRQEKAPADDQQAGPGQEAGGASDQPQAPGSDAAQQNDQPGDRSRQAKGGKTPPATGEKMKPGEGGEESRGQGTPNAGQEKRDAAGEKAGQPSRTGDEAPKDAEGQRKTQPGEGGQSKGAGEPDEREKPEGKPQSSTPMGGDPESKDKGDGGAGSSEGNEKGSPSPQEANAQREKSQDSPDTDAHADSAEKPESPSGSKKQSDSQGGQAGDQSGGGQKGGGQRSNSPGVGSAGQNTAADQGGGEANQEGDGPTGTEGGDQAASKRRTGGKADQQAGEGSRTRPGGEKAGKGQDDAARQPGEDGDNEQPGEDGSDQRKPAEGQKPGDQAAKQQDRPGDQRGRPAQPNDQRGQAGSQRGEPGEGRGSAQDNPTQGGMPGDDTPPLPEKSQAPVPEGDEANLEYSRKATELALEHLKDQLAKEKPDQELLDELRWTRDDIEKFVERWEQLKREANEPGDEGKAARDRLDETLRSLGLRPRGTSLEGGRVRDDRGRKLRESRRSSAPAEYAEQAREYQKGTARSGSAGDQ
ncbi:MAG: hypothetical protein WD847_20740 [Pirellulales bacterium]